MHLPVHQPWLLYKGRVLRVPWNAVRTGRTGFPYGALRWASSRGTQRGAMTVVATIHCKVCRAVFALFSDTLFSRGGREKTCDICGHVSLTGVVSECRSLEWFPNADNQIREAR